ncbi:unnamed protein product [Discosporangium mesarthrocarpum]
MEAYGQDTVHDNGKRHLSFADEDQIALFKTFFSAFKDQGSYTYQGPKGVHQRHRLDYLLTRQSDRCVVP